MKGLNQNSYIQCKNVCQDKKTQLRCEVNLHVMILSDYKHK